jgi:hypothetical protein
MKILSLEKFVSDFGRAAKPTMDMSIYRDSFACACGQSHWFDERIDIICQGFGMKVMVVCPKDPSFLTSIKIKTFMVFKFKGFETLSGARLQTSQDNILLNTIRSAVRV